jgi:hypothetical protein
LFALRRTEFDARGHSGKKSLAIIKSADYGNDKRPAQVHSHKKDGLKVWDARDREFKDRVPSFNISTSLNIDLPIRFTANVALAAGYFTYGNLFRHHVDHRQLRDVMNTDPRTLDRGRSLHEQGLGHLTLRVDEYLREVSEEVDPALFILRSFCSAVKGSVIVAADGRCQYLLDRSRQTRRLQSASACPRGEDARRRPGSPDGSPFLEDCVLEMVGKRGCQPLEKSA